MKLDYETRQRIRQARSEAAKERALHAVDPMKDNPSMKALRIAQKRIDRETRSPGIYDKRPKGMSVTHKFATDSGVIEIRLTNKENRIYEKLLSDPYKVFGIDALSLAADTSHATTRSYIKSIKKKLQSNGIFTLVVNSHGEGYSYRARPVIEIDLEERAA